MNASDPIRPSSADRHGLSRTGLYRRARSGELEQFSRGRYRRADAPTTNLDYLEIASRRPESTLCLASALAFHDLTDIIPASIEIAIPRGTRAPIIGAPVTWHSFDRATFQIGRTTLPIDATSLRIGIYSPERSIVDAFRLRGHEGYELGRDALRAWLREGGKPADLMEVAIQLPRAAGPIRQMLELMV